MIWVVDKTVVPHLVTRGDLLAEVPLRISFEYALEARALVDGSLSIKVLYNSRFLSQRIPELEEDELNAEVRATASSAVSERLALSGVHAPINAMEANTEPVIVAVH